MVRWARNKLTKCPDGIAELTPSAVHELADLIGCSQHELAAYLTAFSPGLDEDTEDTEPRRKRR